MPGASTAESVRRPTNKAAKAGDALLGKDGGDCLELTECRKYFESARQLSDARQYNAALTAYEKAYALRPSAWLLINIGRVQQKLGRPVDAVTSFQRFLADAERQPAEAVDAAREYLKQAESDIAAQREKERLAAQPARSSPAEVSTAARSGESAQAVEKPVYKKWWFWLILGGTAAVAASAVAVGISVGTAGSSEPPRAPVHIAF
jgi:tetratricopeptide (TPR) repeat protein